MTDKRDIGRCCNCDKLIYEGDSIIRIYYKPDPFYILYEFCSDSCKLREIDRLVAEKVMGLKVDDFDFILDEKGLRDGELANYSTNIADAWKVVEKLRDRGILITVETLIDKYKAYYDGRFGAFAETPSLAICLAALKAVGFYDLDLDNEM
jgi:Phage ABA sandwich domain